MLSFQKLFLGYPMVLVIFGCIEKKWVKFEFGIFFLNFQKNFSYFLTFWPKYLALVVNFQRQEDFILWNFLCDNCGKKMSADFSCLFTFFKKKLNVFRFCYHWDNFITNSWLWWIFKFTKFSSKIFGGVAQNFLDENFVNLKIHHNQLFIMKLS